MRAMHRQGSLAAGGALVCGLAALALAGCADLLPESAHRGDERLA